jgi:hypothetical protein
VVNRKKLDTILDRDFLALMDGFTDRHHLPAAGSSQLCKELELVIL